MKKTGLIVAVFLAVTGAQILHAEEVKNPVTPLMLSLLTPAQFPSDQYDVKGLRLDLLYGRCQNLYGVDFGLVNHAIGNEVGLGIGLVSSVDEKFVGLQLGAVNYAKRVSGLQIGLYNGADDMSGMQFGLINHTRLMRGMQLGLVNVIENNDVAFFPIVNFFF